MRQSDSGGYKPQETRLTLDLHTPNVCRTWFLISKFYSESRLVKLREASGLTRNLIIRYTFNIPISLQNLQDMLMYKYVIQEDLDSDESSTFKKLVYQETDTLKWRGEPPRVEIVFDSGISYLLKVRKNFKNTTSVSCLKS